MGALWAGENVRTNIYKAGSLVQNSKVSEKGSPSGLGSKSVC